MKPRASLVCILVLLLCRAAAASMFGEENVTLGSILAENVKQTYDISETLRYVHSLTEEASDIANFANSAVKAVNNVRFLLQNPTEFSKYVLRSWATAYPEVRDIYAHTIDIRMAMGELRNPEFYAHYDPYAYVRAFDSLQNIERGAYEIAIRSADKWGILRAHDPALKAIEEQHRMALDTFSEVAHAINTTGLSPQAAQVLAAKSSTITSLASVEAAETLQRMIGHQQVTFALQQDSADSDLAKMRMMEREATMIQLDWRLRPTAEGPR